MELSVIEALLPAFTAGFAVQRLIEIADPVLDKLKERKRFYLGLLSLAMGFVLVALGRLRVLTHLGATGYGIDLIDFIVTALIISAGTEGFNSILKFLSYKKEEKKAESVQEKLQVRKNLTVANSVALLSTDPADLALSTPQDVMQAALQARVRQFRNNPNLNLDFKNGRFNQHMVSDDDARQVTVEATETAASSFQRILNGDGRTIIRRGITVGTKYGDAVNVMEEALTEGSDFA